MKKVMSYLVFLCISMNILVAMEPQSNKQTINLKLIDDKNKIYSIARWKVVQELYLDATINIPGITEQEILYFDKELDTIDLQKIQENKENKDELKKEIKKKIILHHLPAYKKVFDYLLVSMIADNIHNDRVKSEKAYSFEPKSVKKLSMQDLYIPPIAKLGTDTFNGKCFLVNDHSVNPVITYIPLSTMMCMAKNRTNCVEIYNHNKHLFEHMGTVSYDQININGIGVTTDLRYLVATFDDMLVSKAELYSDSDLDAYKDITNNIKLADIYLLLHLYKAKEQKLRAELHDNEREYIRNYLTTNEKGKELIQKHFLS